MASSTKMIKVARCGPSDVGRELEIVGKIIDEWSVINNRNRHFAVRHIHWSTDISPDLSGRSQSIINKHFDEADIVVAVFWNRLGSPTGLYESGTAEEVIRAVEQKRRVMLYFSEVETLHATDETQIAKVKSFKNRAALVGLYSTFKSRRAFESMFRIQFGQAMHDVMAAALPQAKSKKPTKSKKQPPLQGLNNSHIEGSHNTVNQTVLQGAPRINLIAPPPQGAITPKEKKKITTWIHKLADETSGKPVGEARAMWWSILHGKMEVSRFEDILSTQMHEVEVWFIQQKGILIGKQRRKAPEKWQGTRITAIKAAMRSMGRSNEEYYPEITRRLNLKKPLQSIKQLTKVDLQRVYNLVMNDAKK